MTDQMFFGERPPIARFDKQVYPIFEKLTQQQLGYFWRPEEVQLNMDSKDFKALPEAEKHIFTSNLKRQILLDTVQGRSPLLTLLPISSLPEIENWIVTWAFFETIHSRSYTHIIRNIYPNPSEILDGVLDIPQIVSCSRDINWYYDDLEKAVHGYSFEFKDVRDVLWLCLHSINALEGIRFYVSFACSWAFAELKKMEGNAKIIKFIARDENVHLASTVNMIKLLQKEDPAYAALKDKFQDQIVGMFQVVVHQEQQWAKYLFKDGSMIGLNEELLCNYVEWIAHKRMIAIGLPSPYKGGSNPLPWTQKWIAGGEVQVAPQETEIASYVVGGINKDVTPDTFKGFKL